MLGLIALLHTFALLFSGSNCSTSWEKIWASGNQTWASWTNWFVSISFNVMDNCPIFWQNMHSSKACEVILSVYNPLGWSHHPMTLLGISMLLVQRWSWRHAGDFLAPWQWSDALDLSWFKKHRLEYPVTKSFPPDWGEGPGAQIWNETYQLT